MKIITAIGIEKIINRLKNELYCEIMCKDIIYEDGIFEYLEINSKIDYIIINLEIIKINNLENIIKKIKLINDRINLIFLINNKKIINNNFENNNNIFFININNYLFKNIEKALNKKIENNYNEKNNKVLLNENNYLKINCISDNKKINNKINEKNKIKIISICRSKWSRKEYFYRLFFK